MVLQVQGIRGANLTVINHFIIRKIKTELLTQLSRNNGKI